MSFKSKPPKKYFSIPPSPGGHDNPLEILFSSLVPPYPSRLFSFQGSEEEEEEEEEGEKGEKEEEKYERNWRRIKSFFFFFFFFFFVFMCSLFN